MAKSAKKKVTSKGPSSKSSRAKKPTSIKFDYIKSNHFRVIHVNGVHGGVSIKGDGIQMALFNERTAIPKSETYSIEHKKNGATLKGLLKAESRNTIVREVEVEAILDIATAKAFHGWLGEKIDQLEGLRKR